MMGMDTPHDSVFGTDIGQKQTTIKGILNNNPTLKVRYCDARPVEMEPSRCQIQAVILDVIDDRSRLRLFIRGRHQ